MLKKTKFIHDGTLFKHIFANNFYFYTFLVIVYGILISSLFIINDEAFKIYAAKKEIELIEERIKYRWTSHHMRIFCSEFDEKNIQYNVVCPDLDLIIGKEFE